MYFVINDSNPHAFHFAFIHVYSYAESTAPKKPGNSSQIKVTKMLLSKYSHTHTIKLLYVDLSFLFRNYYASYE